MRNTLAFFLQGAFTGQSTYCAPAVSRSSEICYQGTLLSKVGSKGTLKCQVICESFALII